MRIGLCWLGVVGCYTPPQLDTVPWEAPILSSEGGPLETCAPEREARVACIVDGDTLDIGECGATEGERLRLLGIDAPETAKDTTPADCYADAAAAELARLTQGQVLTLTFDRDCTGVFDRTLAYLWIDRDRAEVQLRADDLQDVLELLGMDDDPEAPVLLNAYLLMKGFVRRYDEDWVEPLYWQNQLVAAERLAQLRGEGLWSACDGR